MSHSNTQRLTDYWQSQRGRALAPLRTHINPSDFADLLPQVFILGRLAAGRYAFRLAGDKMEHLFGHALRNDDFMGLWHAGDRIALQTALEAALRRGTALVIDARALAGNGETADLEILLAPMDSASGEVDRFLGLCQPVSSTAPLRDWPITSLSARHVRLAVQDEAAHQPMPHLKLAAVAGRRLS